VRLELVDVHARITLIEIAQGTDSDTCISEILP
jgi:hypothetical protein